MKPTIMTIAVAPTGADLFDKVKSGCTVAIKPEKETCGCQGHTNNGTMEVTGLIIDKTTKEALIGAHFLNIETQKGTISGDNGQYKLEASGDQMVTISFVGMKDITLPASQVISPIEMEEDTDFLDEVIITAKKSVKNNAGLWVGAGLVSLFVYAKTKKKTPVKSGTNG